MWQMQGDPKVCILDADERAEQPRTTLSEEIDQPSNNYQHKSSLSPSMASLPIRERVALVNYLNTQRGSSGARVLEDAASGSTDSLWETSTWESGDSSAVDRTRGLACAADSVDLYGLSVRTERFNSPNSVIFSEHIASAATTVQRGDEERIHPSCLSPGAARIDRPQPVDSSSCPHKKNNNDSAACTATFKPQSPYTSKLHAIHSMGKAVRFGAVRVYEHRVIVGDQVEELACPLQLGWGSSEHVGVFDAIDYATGLDTDSNGGSTRSSRPLVDRKPSLVSATRLSEQQRRKRIAVVNDLTTEQVRRWEAQEWRRCQQQRDPSTRSSLSPRRRKQQQLPGTVSSPVPSPYPSIKRQPVLLGKTRTLSPTPSTSGGNSGSPRRRGKLCVSLLPPPPLPFDQDDSDGDQVAEWEQGLSQPSGQPSTKSRKSQLHVGARWGNGSSTRDALSPTLKRRGTVGRRTHDGELAPFVNRPPI